MGIIIKSTNGKQFNIDISDFSITINDFKAMLVSQSGLQVNEQRLVFKGKILKDDASLESYGIGNESIVHLVKFLAPISPMTPASAPAVSNAQNSQPFPSTNSNNSNRMGMNTNTNTNNNNPFGSMLGMGGAPGFGFGAPGAGGMGNLRSMMGQNPEMMQQMLNSPLFQGLLNDPDTFRTLMLSNPQIRALVDSNPQFRQVLNDPQTIRQMMEAMRNPNVMQEMMRNQDLAMSNIESMPGGYNALRRMYEEIQEPLNSVSMGNNSTNSSTVAPSTFQPGNSSTPNNAPMPNPWGRSTTNSTTATTPNNNNNNLNQNASTPNIFSLFGNQNMGSSGMFNPSPSLGQANNTNNTQQMPNLSGLFGGIPSFGTPGSMPGMPPMNPALMAQMSSDPMFRNMMRNMLSNPDYLNQLAATNPMFNDPRFREQIQDPQFLERMTNPEYIQAVIQYNEALAKLQSFHTNTPGQAPLPFSGGFGSLFSQSPFLPSTTIPLSTNNSTSTTSQPRANPWASMDSTTTQPSTTNANTSTTTTATTSAETVTLSLKEKYANEIKQLELMGFTDTEKNIEALTRTNGNVNAALDYLLS